MTFQERKMRQMDRDVLGAVVVINNQILEGTRPDTAGPLAAELLLSHRVHVAGQLPVTQLKSRDHEDHNPSSPAALELDRARWDRLQHCAETLASVTAALEEAMAAGSRVIITVGGTGITEGDIAPEATAPLLEIRMDGIAQQVREHGLSTTPLASLSRGLVGITRRGPEGVLIVNAPGSRGGVKDSLDVVGPLLPHIFEQLDDQPTP